MKRALVWIVLIAWIPAACGKKPPSFDHDPDGGTGSDTVIDGATGTAPDGLDGSGDGGDGEKPSAEAEGLTIYYIRHAETEANASGTAANPSANHDTFTELGIEQIDALTEYLLEVDIIPDAVLVSPTWRTQQTIAPYLAEKGITGEIWVELDECYAMQTGDNPLPEEPPIGTEPVTVEVDNLGIRDGTAYHWELETYEACLLMAMTAQDLLLDRFSQTGLTLFVVGHQIAGNTLIGLLTGHDMQTDVPSRLQLRNTGIQELEQDPDGGDITLVAENINDPPVS